MRIVVDTKSDRLIVEVAPGEVVKTLSTEPVDGVPTLEVDLDGKNTVREVRVIGIGLIFPGLKKKAAVAKR